MAGNGAGFLNPGNEGSGPTVSAVVTALGASAPGYTTYQVSVTFDTQHVDDVYALYGDEDNSLVIPPAMQVPTPFGTNVGASKILRSRPGLPPFCQAALLKHPRFEWHETH